jgi:hypothetical protein
MRNDDRGVIGTIIYGILVLLFIKVLFHTIKAFYHWVKNK